MDKYKEFENISLDDLKYFFVSESIIVLNKLGVNNLSGLFKLYDEGNLASYFPVRNYNRILRSVKLLRCKYLDEDPSIDIDNKDIENNCDSLGLSIRAYTCIVRYFNNLLDNNNSFNLFDFIREPNSFEKLSNVRNLGRYATEEVYERVMIVINYYDKHKDDNKGIIEDGNEKETLEYYYGELKRLRDENARIDKEISIVMKKIEEMGLFESESKGRGNK